MKYVCKICGYVYEGDTPPEQCPKCKQTSVFEARPEKSHEELLAEGYKTYENDHLIVYWKPSLCRHVAVCVRGDREVFDPTRRPWVILDNAKTEEIYKIISECPSGALQVRRKGTA